MARRVPLPNKGTPFFESDGKTVSQAWYDYLSFLDALNLPAFSKTAPANLQVPIYNSTTGLYTPGTN
jgi:hypothetical protein